MSGTQGAKRCKTLLSTTAYVFDHDDPDWFGGKNDAENCVVRCGVCDKQKTARDQKDIAKSKRLISREKRTSINRYPPMPGTKRSGFKRHFDGTVTRR